MSFRPLPALSICVLLVVTAAYAQSDPIPPLPERNPVRLGMVLPPKPVPPGEEPTVAWTEAEVSTAKAACKELLKEETIDYDELPPIKEGICGAPAPILVRSISHDPKVVIDPPATIDCPMAKELSDWLEDRVQPLAKKLLATSVVGLHNATSYSCRNRYGSARAPLSEHALVNALDVSEFVMASGKRITVLDAWPKPIADAETKSEDTTKADDADAKDAKGKDAKGKVAVTPAKAEPGDVLPQKHAIVPDSPAADEPAKADKAEPAKSDQAEPAKPSPESEFVVSVHDGACKEFGTVLGPLANEAHKNHFHLDMKARKRTAFCQ